MEKPVGEIRSADVALLCCGICIIVIMVGFVLDSREFKLYQLIYDFKEMEQQMLEEETLSIPFLDSACTGKNNDFFRG